MPSGTRRARRVFALLLLATVPLGFASKLYAGAGASWVRGHAGGIVYEAFWIFGVLALFPRLPAWRVAAGVFLATGVLEALQLWHPPPLEAIRATFLGHALIGSTFAWWDFPHYLAGCTGAALCARRVQSRCQAREGRCGP